MDASNSSAPSILVVEDDVDLQKILRMQLEMLGYKVTAASDGETGFEAAKELVPDLILLDLMMPGLDGFQVLKRVKSLNNLAHIPVVILTASHEEYHRRKGLSLFADGYLTKPYRLPELQATLDRLVVPHV